MGKSTFMYPGYEYGERTGMNYLLFSRCGLGKSFILKFMSAVINYAQVLILAWSADIGVKFTKSQLDILITGSRTKKIMQEIFRLEGKGIVYLPEGGMYSNKFDLFLSFHNSEFYFKCLCLVVECLCAVWFWFVYYPIRYRL